MNMRVNESSYKGFVQLVSYVLILLLSYSGFRTLKVLSFLLVLRVKS